MPSRNGLLVAASALALSVAAAPAKATPTYSLLTTIAIPTSASNSSGTFTGYDLSVFDPSTQLYYLTDRSNNAIDVFSSKTNSFVEPIGQGLFGGSAGGNNNIAGPNGVSISDVSGGKLLLAGNTAFGTSTGNVLAFNLQSNGTTVTQTRTLGVTVAGTTPVPSSRVDGVAYAPNANTILAANNASNPGFITILDNATGNIVKSLVLNGQGGLPNVAGNGVEGPIYNTVTHSFFVSLPNLTAAGTDFGGVIDIDPATGNVLHVYDFQQLGLPGACNPTGLAQGANGTMGLSCGTTGYTVFLDPNANNGAGKITFSTAVSGADQIAYDTSTSLYYEAARFDPNGPALGIFDSNGNFVQRLMTTNNDHSVAVDPISNEAFVAYGASADTANIAGCAKGCIAVFAPVSVAVPEPATLTLLATFSVLGAGLTFRRRNL